MPTIAPHPDAPEPWLSPKVRVLDSPVHGKGMFAVEDIKKGEKIVVWGEDCYTDRAGALQAQREGRNAMQWDEDVFSYDNGGVRGGDDEGEAGLEDQYCLNHSCDPCAWMSDAFTIIARRDTSAGEEITVDYAVFEADEDYASPWECCCGAEACRGTITGKDWRNRELQERYKGHFSPLINKRISRTPGAGS